MWEVPAATFASPVSYFVIHASGIDTGATGFSPWQLLYYGVTPVAWVALIISGQLVPKREHERLVHQLGEARQELAEERAHERNLQATTNERVIPAVTQATLALERIAPLLETETHVRRPRST